MKAITLFYLLNTKFQCGNIENCKIFIDTGDGKEKEVTTIRSCKDDKVVLVVKGE